MAKPTFESARVQSEVAAIVLGGGRGTRLYPLTAERAKPAVPLCGRYRLVDIPLSNCIHSGVNRIFVMTQFNSASLNRHINNSYKFDTFSAGFVEILAAQQTREGGDWYHGTADAVRKHLRHILNLRASHYLILSGDQLYRMDYRSLLATHLRTHADITVAALPVPKTAGRTLGIMRVNKQGRIKEFVEKPAKEKELTRLQTPAQVFVKYHIDAEGQEYLASMGVYTFRAEVLEQILEQERDWVDFGRDVIPNSLKNHRVMVHPFSGFWEDIGTVRSYYDVSMRLVQPAPPFEFYDPHHPIYTRARSLPGSRVQDTTIKNSIICEGSRISEAAIVNSIIGVRTIVQPGAHIEHSIVMGADYYEDEPEGSRIPVGIGCGSRISRAIIDKNARVGKGVVIQGSDTLEDQSSEGFAIRDGIVVVRNNGVIPDGTRIG